MIPYGRQDITDADVKAVVEALRSDFLTQGPAVDRFETAVADQVGAQFGVAVNSATSALHIACMALDVGPGDLVWTVPNTFVASANCARYCGADLDFVDIDATTWNLSVPRLREKLVAARTAGRLPKVIIPVHFSGQATDQEAIWKLAEEYGVRVIEDASHSIGGSRHGEPIGSCRWSHITVFSFHPVKIITSGEGGMCLTNDAALAESLRMARSHGITRSPARFRSCAPDSPEAGPWYYEQHFLGYNYRMTDIQAALGSSQLTRLAANVERRNLLARRYDSALRGLPIELPTIDAGNVSAFHLYVIRTAASGGVAARRKAFDALRGLGIGVNVHYLPVHVQPYYRDLGFRAGMFPEAERHGSTAITLPLYAALTEADQDRVIDAVRRVLRT